MLKSLLHKRLYLQSRIKETNLRIPNFTNYGPHITYRFTLRPSKPNIWFYQETDFFIIWYLWSLSFFYKSLKNGKHTIIQLTITYIRHFYVIQKLNHLSKMMLFPNKVMCILLILRQPQWLENIALCSCGSLRWYVIIYYSTSVLSHTVNQ